jgi:hypothetical protein
MKTSLEIDQQSLHILGNPLYVCRFRWQQEELGTADTRASLRVGEARPGGFFRMFRRVDIGYVDPDFADVRLFTATIFLCIGELCAVQSTRKKNESRLQEPDHIRRRESIKSSPPGKGQLHQCSGRAGSP